MTRSDCFFIGALTGAITFALLLFTSGCAVDMKHKGDIGVQISIDEKIEKYFEARCKQQLAPLTPTLEMITACKDAAIGEFLETIGESDFSETAGE